MTVVLRLAIIDLGKVNCRQAAASMTSLAAQSGTRRVALTDITRLTFAPFVSGSWIRQEFPPARRYFAEIQRTSLLLGRITWTCIRSINCFVTSLNLRDLYYMGY